MKPEDLWIDVRPDEGGLRLHVRRWDGDRQPFVLVHGLASNGSTWDAVAAELASNGHIVVAVDQRGHGLSDKPATGYDFDTIADDLVRLLDRLGYEQSVMAGQSWGGNVVLDLGARYPTRASQLIFVDGGYLDLQMRPGATWEQVAEQLRPPALAGMLRTDLEARLRTMHPDWTDAGVEATLGNFETLPDGAVRPWLSLDRHMQILRALWEQRPGELYSRVQAPVLIVAAEDPHNPAWMAVKRQQVDAAQAGLAQVSVHWFADTAHDIHVHRPKQLAAVMLSAAAGDQ